MGLINLLLSCLLLPLVWSHSNYLCTQSSAVHPGQLNFFLYTYHSTPGVGGSVPGTCTIQTPSGQRSTFSFTSFARFTTSGGQILYNADVNTVKASTASAVIASQSNGARLDAIYGDFDGFKCYGGTNRVGHVLSGTEQPHVPVWGNSNILTVYIATLQDATSGQYLFWTDNTDQNLDSGCQGFVGACIDGESSSSQITIDVIKGGTPCQSSDFPQSSDYSIPNSLELASQPGSIVVPDCISSKPFASGGVECMPDGSWANTFTCSSTPGCRNSLVTDFTESRAIGAEAYDPQFPSCDGFNVPQGSVCHVNCQDGFYAKRAYTVRCDGQDNWVKTSSSSESCRPISESAPPSKPTITDVNYDTARGVATVAFDFQNNPDDDMVFNWEVTADNSGLVAQNRRNSVIEVNSLDMTFADDSSIEGTVCYQVSVENGSGKTTSDQFCKADDVDECAEGTHTCDPNATCTNEAPGFSCDCNTGFTGDGHTCQDVDECTAGTHTCDANASCSNNAGGYSCSCNLGFLGDGHACQPGLYNVLSGVCRTAEGKAGTYTRVDAATPEDCKQECTDDDNCKAYEFTFEHGCEIHTDVITKAKPLSIFADCGIKKGVLTSMQSPDGVQYCIELDIDAVACHSVYSTMQGSGFRNRPCQKKKTKYEECDFDTSEITSSFSTLIASCPTATSRVRCPALYTVKTGACRTEQGQQGTYTRVGADTPEDCKKECTDDNNCKAYEFTYEYGCEIHTDPITKTALPNFFAECGLKVGGSYNAMPGTCQVAEGKDGRPGENTASTTLEDCTQECTDDKECKAYEYTARYGCKIHKTDVDSHTDPPNMFAECGIKSTDNNRRNLESVSTQSKKRHDTQGRLLKMGK